MARFVVYGTCSWIVASLCVHADTASEAKAAWAEAFKNRGIHPELYDVACWNLDGEEAWMEEHPFAQSLSNPLWRGAGHTHWSGIMDGNRYVLDR